MYDRLSVGGPKGLSADFAAICGRVSEHPILVLPSVFPIDEKRPFRHLLFSADQVHRKPCESTGNRSTASSRDFLEGGGRQNKKSHFTAIKSIQTGRKTS